MSLHDPYLDPRRWEAQITRSDEPDDPDLPRPRSNPGLSYFELLYLRRVLARRLTELVETADRLDRLSRHDPPGADAPAQQGGD